MNKGDPGQHPRPEQLIDTGQLLDAFFEKGPDPSIPAHRVSFGTSGHRGSSLDLTFNESHIHAITQSIIEYRDLRGINGPIMVGKDTHALSGSAERSAIEVLAANNVPTRIQKDDGITATPVISRAILSYNRSRSSGLSDGIIITPSHNPPRDGGFKYNPPHGGPAGSNTTQWIEQRANEIMEKGNRDVRLIPYENAIRNSCIEQTDFTRNYVEQLCQVINIEAIRSSGLKLGVHPLGGASLPIWGPLSEIHGVEVEVVDDTIDPQFAFMTLDKDGLIRMDCSSRWAMAPLLEVKDQFDLAFGNDPDSDRHGIVCRSSGLMNPNRYLAVAINHLLKTRNDWPSNAAIGKTLVSSCLIDRVVESSNRSLCEVPVGFKWFAEGLHNGTLGFGGEESAGASFLQFNGAPWTTDKDGIIMDLLAAEIMAVTALDPGEHEEKLTDRFGSPCYQRIQSPTDAEQRARLKNMSPEDVTVTTLGGDPIRAILTRAPGNDASIGGLKIVTDEGWFAARPSGTEPISKIYAESMRGEQHLQQILDEAQLIVNTSAS